MPESAVEELPQNPQTKKFDKSAFVYDEQSDVYYCPQGKTLSYNEKKSKLDAEGHRTYFAVYRCDDCRGCCWDSACRMGKAKRGRSVSRDEHEKRRREFARKMAGEESQTMYRKRFHAAETPFGIIKQIMHLRQFLVRGLEKVKTEWLWACTALNLAKLVRETGRLRAEFSKLIAKEES